jgi:serine/threonine protein kinase
MKDSDKNNYVVVKTIEMKSKGSNSRNAAEKETRLIKMFQHPNVLQIYDSFLAKLDKFCLILEYADGKDILKYIE